MDKKVLIVDDDNFIRYAVRQLFESKSIGVEEAGGVGQCLDVLKKGFSGVVLMDVMMPGSDGWDTIRAIIDAGLYKDIIIVMLTARDVPDDKMHGLQEYVTDYVTKPFESEQLVLSVQEYFKLIN